MASQTAPWAEWFRLQPHWGGLDGPLAMLIQRRLAPDGHGDMPAWQAALAALPDLPVDHVRYDDTVRVAGDADPAAISRLRDALRLLHPWRKGPFLLFGVAIDTEWRSDWKWARVAPHLARAGLANATVLDVGCGNGYFGWRLLDAGARRVVGVDPTLLYCMQHQAIARYTGDARNLVLPLRFEELPATPFDMVLSMGVVYHRRDPIAHVAALADCLAPGGTLVLESLVTTRTSDLIAPPRYARMRNVWHVPAPETLAGWVRSAGLLDARVVDITTTTTDEQRRTAWMTFESLADALDPTDSTRTIEGLPAPERAIVLARKPG
ncbi:MAG: tRNA 5-methoxyuridine(34)/uridine 5-oxyacetic acid(34) synthase CmoB [Gammaproteobacteria bacterium]